MCVAINLSAKDILNKSLLPQIKSRIAEAGLSTTQLAFEITESDLVSDAQGVYSELGLYREAGFTLAIDDFGTGYSSLAYLKELPIAELKVDKYFVDDIDDDSDKAEFVIVDAIINIAKALGVQCVAEGVENEVQRNYLSRIGCDIFQGYHFSKPLLDEEWRRFIRSAHFS